MKCDRCGGEMLEEQLVVVGGVVRVKGVSAWHCWQCGRVEYKAMAEEHNMVHGGNGYEAPVARAHQ